MLMFVSQYKTPLNQQYKLPKMKYKGKEIENQRVRSKRAPVIEEVTPDVPKPKVGGSKTTTGASSRAPVPAAKLKPVPVQHATSTINFVTDSGSLLPEVLPVSRFIAVHRVGLASGWCAV
jgi:hypothetical protein